MPYPAEYQRASDFFSKFLTDVKNISDVGSVHQAYTMAQGVFQVYRRRLTHSESITFLQALNAGLRALYSSDWDPNEKILPWDTLEKMNAEVRLLRPEHNFSTKSAIQDVSKALRMNVELDLFKSVLNKLPLEAKVFWNH
jgi:uncharacterized protein (DUF2267 family)